MDADKAYTYDKLWNETKDLGVQGILKLMCKKCIKERRETSDRCEKAMMTIGYEALLQKTTFNFDLNEEELRLALVLQVYKMYVEAPEQKPDEFNRFIELMKMFNDFQPTTYNKNDILTILFLLRCSNQPVQIAEDTQKEPEENLSTAKSYASSNTSIIENPTWKDSNDELFLGLKNVRRTWENFGLDSAAPRELYTHGLDLHINLIRDFTIQYPFYVSRQDLRKHIMCALVGVASPSFLLEDSSITMEKGLITDGIDEKMLKTLLESVAKAGMAYISLRDLPRKDKCPHFTKKILPSLQYFLDTYNEGILRIPDVPSITLWIKYLTPYFEKIFFVTNCLKNYNSIKKLLERLYYIRLDEFLYSDVFALSQAFLLDGCTSYFEILDAWLFQSECHPELFVEQHAELTEIVDKRTWVNIFTYCEGKAPDFLSCWDIYDCGRRLALLKRCASSHPLIELLNSSKRPHLTLCKSIDELDTLKKICDSFGDCVNKLVEYQQNLKYKTYNSCDENSISDKEQNILDGKGSTQSENESAVSDKETTVSDQEITVSDKETTVSDKETDSIKPEVDQKSNFKALYEYYRAELFKRYELIEQDIAAKTNYYLWLQGRARQNLVRKTFLRELYKPKCEGELTFLPVPSTIAICTKHDENENQNEEIVETHNKSNLVDSSNLSLESVINIDKCDASPIKSDNENDHNDPKSLETDETCNVEILRSTPDEKLEFEFKIDSKEQSDIEITNLSERFEDIDIESKNFSPELQVEEDLTCKAEPSEECFCDNQELVDCFEDPPLKFPDIVRPNNSVIREVKKLFKPKLPKHIYGEDECENVAIIKYLIAHSVLIPLRMQTNLVNRALITVFLEDNRFLETVNTLTNLFLLMDGQFACRFVNCLCSAFQTVKPMTYDTLNALQVMLSDSRSPRYILSIKRRSVKKSDSYDPQLLDCVTINFVAKWPLNVLLTPMLISKYDSILSFLLTFERTFWTLKNLYLTCNVKHINLSSSAQYRKIHLYKFIMTNYIITMILYFRDVAIGQSWNNFITGIENVESLELLYSRHVDFIKNIRASMFFAVDKLYQALLDLNRTVLMFCDAASVGVWNHIRNDFKYSNFVKAEFYFSNFYKITKYITAYVDKLSERGYSELDILVGILSLTSFYLNK